MFILEVVPVKRAIGKENLSYFSKTDVPIGTIVSVPIRGKSSDALVIKSTSLESEKFSIKSKSFALKKISKIKGAIFRKSFLKAAKKVARIYAATTGSVLSQFTPSVILENGTKVTPTPHEKKSTATNNIVAEHLIVQDENDDRYATYKSLIREEFAKNSSVFFCLPASHEAKKSHKILEKGISEYTFCFHSAMSTKEILEKWNAAIAETHPVLIVATPSFISLPRTDISMIIVEQESSRHYKMQTRPYADARVFAEEYADEIDAKVVFGDIALRVETISRYRQDELHGVLPPKFKYLSSAREILVDMKIKVKNENQRQQEKSPDKREFEILGDRLKNLIEKTRDGNEHMLIFAARRGLSPTTVCSDCGEIVKCENCNTPTVLHKAGSKTAYLCHRCNNIESAERRCLFCQSWKLAALGVGIESVEESVRKSYPNIRIFRVDSDTTKTEARVLAEIEKWKNNLGSILICTELALPYVDAAENVAVASIDSLFSVPDFRINEKIIGILLQLRGIALKNFLLKTRQPDQAAIRAGISGNLLDFYHKEIEEREEFGYPPFSKFIKLSLVGEKQTILKDMKNIEPLFEGYEFDVFPAMSGSIKGKAVLNALVKLKKDEWPDDLLLEKLTSLPQKFTIKVDPDSLL